MFLLGSVATSIFLSIVRVCFEAYFPLLLGIGGKGYDCEKMDALKEAIQVL